jgi:hypothetical protein
MGEKYFHIFNAIKAAPEHGEDSGSMVPSALSFAPSKSPDSAGLKRPSPELFWQSSRRLPTDKPGRQNLPR